MKKWCIILAFLLLCLAGCSRQSSILSRPHCLEITYGDRSVFAMTGGYEWNWKDGRKTETAVADTADPRTMGQKLSYLSTGSAQTMELSFSSVPDKFLVEVFSSADGYEAGEYVDAATMSIPAPLDGEDHLYSVTAVWGQEQNPDGWGTCTYHFRFLAEAETAAEPMVTPDVGDLEISQILQMQANDFMGMEVVNNKEGISKTFRTGRDKSTILQFLKDNVTTDFSTPMSGAPKALYQIRLVAMDGSQLTVSYGSDGLNHSLLAGGMAYAVEEMDFDRLWALLGGFNVTENASTYHLGTSEEFPGEDWGTDFVHGYITELGATVTYDGMQWFESDDAPSGYRLEKGWPDQSIPVSADCEYWILENHQSPYCKVSAENLMAWTKNAQDDVLYRIYTKEDAVIAICEQYVP